jgi:cyclomaltodextrinase / maltogenic alpha-amylase / neopullulanase
MTSLLLGLVLILTPQETPHTFTYRAERDHKTVHVAGTFNHWDKSATLMDRGADGRTWTKTLRLEPGKHLYKFVLDGEEWITDPKSVKDEDDGNGHINSVLMIWPKGYEVPARKGDGRITETAILHETDPPFLNYDRGHLQLALRVRPNDVATVAVLVGNQQFVMTAHEGDELHQLYTARVPWDRKQNLQYTFFLQDGPLRRYFGPGGLSAEPQRFMVDATSFQPFTVPAWAEGAVFYQIFPDRFENGDPRNDPKTVVPWDAKPTYYNRYGGDIAGVIKRLDHLVDLGIKGVYFNPVFESPANHRYEASDFLKIDPEFGTNEEFAHLTRLLKSKGIYTVLDGVFNHTAPTFPPFADIVEKGKESRYVDWYFIKSFPVKVGDPPNYEAWFGFPSMPKVNLANPDAKAYMLNVPTFWHERADIAGWRLDVANEVPMWFWREFRSHVKSLDPDNWIVGEVWGDGRPWLKGDQWDSIMGYQFRDAALRFIAEGRWTPTQFMNRLIGVHHSYAPQVSRNLMILLGSHDTPRFITLCGGDAQLAKLGATLQLTWVGSPSIYYGEELGMAGEADPNNRRGMNWGKATPNNPMLEHYRRLVAARNASKALKVGDPVVLATDDAQGTLAFARTMDRELAVVAVNRSDSRRSKTIQLPANLRGSARGEFRDALTDRTYRFDSSGRCRIELPPKSSVVLLPAAITPRTGASKASPARSQSTHSRLENRQ